MHIFLYSGGGEAHEAFFFKNNFNTGLHNQGLKGVAARITFK
jgi:hypothetical protein